MAEHHDTEKKTYEPYLLHSIKPVLIGMGSILAVVVLAFAGMYLMFHGLEKAEISTADTPPPMAAHKKPYNGLLLQANPPAELSVVRSQALKTLSEYGWVDKDAGVVHIPIGRAMDMALKRGYPVRNAQGQTPEKFSGK